MFLILRITAKSRVKVCMQWRMALSPSVATDRSKAVMFVYFKLNVFGVGVSCRVL